MPTTQPNASTTFDAIDISFLSSVTGGCKKKSCECPPCPPCPPPAPPPAAAAAAAAIIPMPYPVPQAAPPPVSSGRRGGPEVETTVQMTGFGS
jgi:hypothetical protein